MVDEIKQILKPGFRYAKCKNKECGKKFETAMQHKDITDCVCSGLCHFMAVEQQSNTLMRFSK